MTGPTTQASQHDAPLLTALARAFHWQRLLNEGHVSSQADLARREGLHPTTVGDVLRLVLLAPQIVEMVVDGQQPRTLSLTWLESNPPPRDWQVQQALFDDLDAVASGSKPELGRGRKSKPPPRNPRR